MYPKTLFWLKRGSDLHEVWAVSLSRSSGLLGRDMAADYEHNRSTKHASGVFCKIMLFLLFCAWCGITHIGIAIRAIPHDNAYNNKTRASQHVCETCCFTSIRTSKRKMHASIYLQTNLLDHPVGEIGCIAQHQNYKNQWPRNCCKEVVSKDETIYFIQQNYLDECEQIAFCQQNNTRHHTTDEQCMMSEMNENDGNGDACGIAHNLNQGYDDQTSRPLPLSHWCGVSYFRKVRDQCLQIRTLLANDPCAGTLNLSTEYLPKKRGCATKRKNNPWTWTLIGLFIVLSEIFHAIIAQEHLRRREVRKRSKAAGRCNPVRAGIWTFVVRMCLCLGLFWFVGTWGSWCGPISHPLTLIKKPNKHRRAKYTKQHTSKLEKFAVEVEVFFHGIHKPLHVNHIIGDGNCYWRAAARQTKYSWYRLKKLTLGYMKQYAKEHCDEKIMYEAKQLSKKNAWANMLAVLGTAAFLKKDIRICTRQHIINCAPWPHDLPAPRGSRDAINLYFDKQHYSGVDAEDVQNRIAAVDQTLGCSLKEFTSIPINSYPEDKIVHRHRTNHHSKNFKRRSRSVQSFTPRDSMTPKPKYRPAGPGPSGQRRPNESFEQQIARIVKAKSASISAGNSSGSSGASPAKATPMIPTQPPGPPPGWRRPPTPPARPSRAPDLQITSRPLPPPPPRVRREVNDEGERVPEPKTPPQTPPVINIGDEGLVHDQFRMREALVCSGGQRFQWRTPGLSDNSVVLLEDLFHVKDNDPANRLYGHLGVHVQSMQKFARQPRFIESIVKQITAALSMESAILIYQCTSGRHRSVAAVQITKDVFQNLVPNATITTRHLSSYYWKPSTCGGECGECNIIINDPPVPYKDLVNQISQMVRARTGEAYMADCNCTGNRNARLVGLIGGFSDSAVLSVRCCLQLVKVSRICQRSSPQLDVSRCHLVLGNSGSFWFIGGV